MLRLKTYIEYEAVSFCCTFLGVASTGCYPAPCPAELGLSSAASYMQPRSPDLLTFRLYSPIHNNMSTVLCQMESAMNIFTRFPGLNRYFRNIKSDRSFRIQQCFLPASASLEPKQPRPYCNHRNSCSLS